MAEGPVRCPDCGQTDFYVISTGASWRGGTLLEIYRWPEGGEAEEAELHDLGYHVDQQVVEEPELVAIEGRVKALCLGCLRDLTDAYLARGRAESLPV